MHGKGGQHHPKQQRPHFTHRPTADYGDDDDVLGPSAEEYDDDATQPTLSRRNEHHFSIGDPHGIGAGAGGNGIGGRQHGKHANGGGGGSSFGVKEQRKSFVNGGTPDVRVNTDDNEVSAARAATALTRELGVLVAALAVCVVAGSALWAGQC